jgi:D-lyxose ketol-isomerase
MKRSEINQLVRDASACFAANGWALPPNPRWDVTDFGLGDWRQFGLVLVNLAEQAEYCEKLMYAKRGMVTPAHYHQKKKEDIIARWGSLQVTIWREGMRSLAVPINGERREITLGEPFVLSAGERITLLPGIVHAFEPASDECIIGEVSTANDDLSDNFFVDSNTGRFPGIVEDEEALVILVNDP